MVSGKIFKKALLRPSRSARSDFSINKAHLSISDGIVYEGKSYGKVKGQINGEVVFNTGMTGYIESLTDPSYSNQILVFTYPMIGNYGVQLADLESKKIQVRAIVVSQFDDLGSHSDSTSSLPEWLAKSGIPVLFGIDTRALTMHLREAGTMLGAISRGPIDPKELQPVSDYFVTIDKPTSFNPKGKKKVILVDCGAKENIMRSLVDLNLHVLRVPMDYDYTKQDYDGVVISNGPGDPTDYKAAIRITKKALAGNKPVFGICLGNQLMALAAGAKTYKLRYGHRGHNQPCVDKETRRCYITSQNHGYAIDAKSLPRGWQVSFSNLNDGSVEGIKHRTKPFFSVQFHPEACPGPTDTAWLFKKFVGML
jgi:carbamoyl-phosphate synthase small subunit